MIEVVNIMESMMKFGLHPGPYTKFLERNDMCSQCTMPSTHQQNGVAERLNRTLIEMVMYMLINFSLPILFMEVCIKDWYVFVKHGS